MEEETNNNNEGELVTYEKMNFADLFNEVQQELVQEEIVDIQSGKTKKVTVLDSRLAQVLSQKAKSFFNYLGVWKSGHGMYSCPATELILLKDEFEIVEAAFFRLNDETCFLRACPEVARHGVIESIEVTATTLQYEWSRLRAIMQQEDPNGCMILQPFIPATSSMVMAPNEYAVIGPDHDGVTAGHGFQLNYLLNPNNPSAVDHFAKIGHSRGTYELEYVYQRDDAYLSEKYKTGTMHLTQIRGAPPHPMPMPPFKYQVMRNDGLVEVTSEIQGIVPGTGIVTVSQVWQATGLEEVAWLEENITKELCPEGFVISHPNGSLASHIYAHARGHDIPYIIGDAEVGETWVEGSPCNVAKEQGHPITPEPYDPYNSSDIQRFQLGLALSTTRWQRQQGWFAHNFHQWLGMNINPTRNGLLAGAFSGWAVKAALGLCLGELRYAKGMKKDADPTLLPVIAAAVGKQVWIDITDGSGEPSKQRKHYYVAMERLDLDYTEIMMALNWCVKQFKTGWSSGAYGGKNWAACAEGAAVLCSHILAFQKNPCADTLKHVVIHTNKAENFAHNNGSLYNKFLSGSCFDQATLNSDSGKGLFSHSESGLCDMFRAYEVARTFIEGKANQHNAPPVNDWRTLFRYANSVTHNTLRKNIICVSKHVPVSIRDAAILLGPDNLHHSNPLTLNNDKFIPCGHEDCEKCADLNILTLSIEHDLDFTSMLLESEHPSAFFALPAQKSELISYHVGNLIKQKNYDDITPEMFVDAWNGLNTQDVMYKVLSEMMKKHLKKMLTTNVEYSKMVATLLGKEVVQ